MSTIEAPATERSSTDKTSVSFEDSETPASKRARDRRSRGRIIGGVIVGAAVLGVVYLAVNGGPVPEFDTQVLDLGEQDGWSFEVHFTTHNEINATFRAPDGTSGQAQLIDATYGTLFKRGENRFSNLDGMTIGAYAVDYGVCSSEAAVLHGSTDGKWTATSIPMDHLQLGATGVSPLNSSSVGRDYIYAHQSIGLICVPNSGING